MNLQIVIRQKSCGIGIALWLSASAAIGGEYTVSPYVDPAQLNCPWPKTSHYEQPWRGYLETMTPNFKRYEARIDGGTWAPTPSAGTIWTRESAPPVSRQFSGFKDASGT